MFKLTKVLVAVVVRAKMGDLQTAPKQPLVTCLYLYFFPLGLCILYLNLYLRILYLLWELCKQHQSHHLPHTWCFQLPHPLWAFGNNTFCGHAGFMFLRFASNYLLLLYTLPCRWSVLVDGQLWTSPRNYLTPVVCLRIGGDLTLIDFAC